MGFEEMPKKELNEAVIEEYIEEIKDTDDMEIGASILMGMEERYQGEVSRRLEEDEPELWSRLEPVFRGAIEENMKDDSQEQ